MRVFFLFLLSALSLIAYDAPYRLEKFQNILKESKLQAPTSYFDAKYSTDYGQFQYFGNKYFYLQDNQYMTFSMCNKKHRSELREKEEWHITTQKKKIFFATVFLFPLNEVREFTFLQIHADPNYPKDAQHLSINKPLLRIVWKKNYHGKKEHIWAVIRTSPYLDEQKYIKKDLGAYHNEFFSVKISVKNSQLTIFMDQQQKVSISVSYWNKMWNYFKAGVYLQDNGCAKVLFKKLLIK